MVEVSITAPMQVCLQLGTTDALDRLGSRLLTDDLPKKKNQKFTYELSEVLTVCACWLSRQAALYRADVTPPRLLLW